LVVEACAAAKRLFQELKEVTFDRGMIVFESVERELVHRSIDVGVLCEFSKLERRHQHVKKVDMHPLCVGVRFRKEDRNTVISCVALGRDDRTLCCVLAAAWGSVLGRGDRRRPCAADTRSGPGQSGQQDCGDIPRRDDVDHHSRPLSGRPGRHARRFHFVALRLRLRRELLSWISGLRRRFVRLHRCNHHGRHYRRAAERFHGNDQSRGSHHDRNPMCDAR
jgi:hypothetical protein